MRPASPNRLNDPLRYTLPLPYQAELYPMGFPLRIAANHPRVLPAAEALWSQFPRLFACPPSRINVTVDTGDGGALPGQPPVLRGQENLLSIVADRANFATADLTAGFAHICVVDKVASDAAYFRYHFLEPLAYVLISARHAAFVHASCVALDGQAVLLSGPSGAGKTCLAYACARRGWTFLSGDAVAVVSEGGGNRIAGRPFEIRFRHTAPRLFPELARFPPQVRPSGKADIEVDPHHLDMSLAVDGMASHLVFLDRTDPTAEAELAPIDPRETRLELEEGICFGDLALRERHRVTLDRMAQLPAYRLRYSEIDSAERTLRSLVGVP